MTIMILYCYPPEMVMVIDTIPLNQVIFFNIRKYNGAMYVVIEDWLKD
jgi:hypothetical protein